jgi:hypothetical protein
MVVADHGQNTTPEALLVTHTGAPVFSSREDVTKIVLRHLDVLAYGSNNHVRT